MALGHTLIATATENKALYLCDIRSGSQSHTLSAHSQAVMDVHFSPANQNLLVSGGKDGRVIVWDVRKSQPLLMSFDQLNATSTTRASSGSQVAHTSGVCGVRYTPDGMNILSLGCDNRLVLWDAFTGRNQLVNYPNIRQSTCNTVKLAISTTAPRAPQVIVPRGRDIIMYDMHTGMPTKTLRGHYNTVRCLAFHPFEPVSGKQLNPNHWMMLAYKS